MRDAGRVTLKARNAPERPGERQLLDEVRRARTQIEAHQGGRLGWLLDFTAEEPKRWLPGEAEAHGYRMLAFVHQLPPNLVGGANISPLSVRDVTRLRAELSAFLRSIVSEPPGSLIPIPSEGLSFALVRASAPGAKPAAFGFSRGGPLRTVLYQEVAALVRETDRLIACPGPACGRPFLALRKMKFCSPKCAERWHNQRKVDASRKGGPRDAR
jgi:hypothetical protein